MNHHQRVIHVATLVVISVCALAPSALAQECPELVGRWPYGPVAAVAVRGGYAYIGSGTAVVVVEVSDPSWPVRVGFADTPDYVQDITIEGSYAYVADGWAGLRIVDISNPSEPVEVGSVATPDYAQGVAVAGTHAYVADRWSGLRVVDVSNPLAPREVGFVGTPWDARAVAVAGGYAYVAAGPSGLRVLDVSNPAAPVEVGFYDGAEVHGVASDGAYVYTASWSTLRVVDVSNPAAPVEVGVFDGPRGAEYVAVTGGRAYLAEGVADVSGFWVLDVSTPSAPIGLGYCDTPGYPEGIAVADAEAFVANGPLGLRVVDVSDPAAPLEIGVLPTPASARGVDVVGSYAYVADGGLWVLDISNPAAPVDVGSCDTQGYVQDVAVMGRYAYVAAYGSGLRVVDVSNPVEPVEVGFYDTYGSAVGVVVAGRYAYVADYTEGLVILDISNPQAPTEVSWYRFLAPEAISVVGSFVYSADGYGGLHIVDVSDPSAPIEVGALAMPDTVQDVAVVGNYAFLAGPRAGLRVVDVSNPVAPREVGSIEWPDEGPWGVAVSRGKAYLGCASRLRVVDVSEPSVPVEVGSVATPLWSASATVAGGNVFLSNGGAGLSIFSECSQSSPAVRTLFIPAAAVAAGAHGAFFQTDVEINNTGAEEAQLTFQWLPRGEDNSEPVNSEEFTLAPGASLRYENVLTELFGLEPDSLGALKMVASTESVIGMSRTYNIPAGKIAGTFGQGLPAVRATEMIQGSDPQRIIFLSENDDSRANVGCVNGSSEPLRINIGVFDAEGTFLETKTMDLGPYSNNQINRVFRDYQPVNGYVDVWTDSDDALYYCYGSMLDNETSDPTTILPQVPSSDVSFIPAAALAAGLEGAFFSTDVDLNNVGSTDITYELLWLPRGADNSDPVSSNTFSLAPGAGVRYANVLNEVFGLEPDQVGALAVEASGIDLLAMSRTYNLPTAKVAGTFGQELPGIPADRMIQTGVKKRIIFMNENDDVRANVGCVNGVGTEVAVQVELYDSDGVKLETKYMMLPPYSNRQINGIFQDYAPTNGYVDVQTSTPGASIYCYGSVLDNATSDPTTVLPQ